MDEIKTPSLDVPALVMDQPGIKERQRITAPRRSRSRSPIALRRPGDWDCRECNGMNYAARLYCYKCKAPKDTTMPKFEDSKLSKDWECGMCSESNFGTRKNCYKCSAPISAFNPANQKMSNDWECLECGGNNFSRRIDCFRCHAVKPSPQRSIRPPSDSKYQNDWLCPECSGNNYSKRLDCYKCSAKKPDDDWNRRPVSYRSKYQVEQPKYQPSFNSKYQDDWLCPNCTGNNFSKRLDCYKCKTLKPEQHQGYSIIAFEDESRDMRYRIGMRPRYTEPVRNEPPRNEPPRSQDWECSGCGGNNFSRRVDCFRCHMVKPGGVAESKFKNDWICVKCQGNNFSRRVDCYKCKEPKPC